MKLLPLDQALVLRGWMVCAKLFDTFCVSFIFVHDMIFDSSPYVVYFLRIVDVLIFSVRFFFWGEDPILFAHIFQLGTPTNSYST